MREIKFRAWNKNWEMMSVCTGIRFDDDGDISSAECLRPSDVDFFPEWLSVDDVVLMQYTGLKDKNGVEVYEGDVVRCSSGCPHEIRWLQEVPTSNIGGMPGFYLSGLFSGYAWTGYEEVIGNIYDHPHLLDDKISKQKKQRQVTDVTLQSDTESQSHD